MTPRARDAEKGIELTILLIHLVFTIKMIRKTLTPPCWELWTVPFMVISIAALWWLYLRDNFTTRTRTKITVVVCLINLFFYGIHPEVFGDHAMLLALFMMAYSSIGDKWLITLGAMSYAAVFLYGLFVTGAVREMWELYPARLELDIEIMLAVPLFARFMMSSRVEEESIHSENINRMLEEKTRMEHFLANVSHELRTPVGIVAGMADAIPTYGLAADTAEKVKAVREAAQTLSAQIISVTECSDVISGRVTVASERYDTASLINDIVASAAGIAAARNLEAVFDADASIPAAMTGDAARIRSMALRLVDNAAKFTASGGFRVLITARRDGGEANLVFRVDDTGIGMSPAEIEAARSGFYQADGSVSRRAGGLGLGITIVSGLASAMEGFFTLKSRKHGAAHGTSASFCVPQGIADDRPWTGRVAHGRGLRALIVASGASFKSARMREYFSEMIDRAADGLGISCEQASSFGDAQLILGRGETTHVIISGGDYAEHEDFFRGLSGTSVAVIGGEASPGGVMSMRPPFWLLPFAEIARGELHARELPELPEKPAPDGEPAPAQAAAPKAPGEDINRRFARPIVRARALVVDDDGMNLRLAREILNSFGIEADTAESGAEALRKCGAARYDVIFMDYMMPEMDGLETFRRIRGAEGSRNAGTPVIALTAAAVSGIKETLLSAGFDDFVSKPIELAALDRAIRRVLLPPAPMGDLYIPPETAEPLGCPYNPPPPPAPIGGLVPASGPAPAAGPAPAEEQRQEQKTEQAPEQTRKTRKFGLPELDALARLGADVASGLEYCAGMEDMYLDMARDFGEMLGGRIEELRGYAASGDADGYRVKVHALKTNFRTLGFTRAGELAAEIEAVCKEGRAEDAASRLTELEAAASEVSGAIKEAMGR